MTSGFSSFPLSPDLIQVLAELEYAQPTPIQQAALPVLLEGKDLIGQSETGSGKTAAFGLALLQKIDVSRAELTAMVLCPTRELAAQVARELRKLGRRMPGLQVRTVSGGEPVRAQATALKRGVHIVVGTPGRVLDHMGRGNLELSCISSLVLDEADRMLEMGFQADIEAILSEVPSERQTMLFSATFPQSIEKMSSAHQREAVRITVKQEQTDTPSIEQVYLHAEAPKKMSALLWALDHYAYESAIIFCNQKATVADIERELHLCGASVDCLHGDLEQFQRDQVIALLRSQSVRILVATDVAARGIDVEGLDLVINYELPTQAEVYVHRIGRTGRAGRTGQAVSLVSDKEAYKLEALKQVSGGMSEASWSKEISGGNLRRPALMQMIQIGGGRRDKVRPGDILGALTGEAGGFQAADIGKIEIHDRFSYVAVALGKSPQAVRSLSNGRIKGKKFRATILR